jgi:ribonuclease-3
VKTSGSDPRHAGSGRSDALEQALGYRFKDRSWLDTALVHRSYRHEQGGADTTSYERLEFLGDAVLGLCVADWLFRDDTGAEEGRLSKRRQMVVRTSSLAAVATSLGLGRAILLGRGEEQTGGRSKPSLLADVFEAVLGAVYLDGGIRQARAFVHRHLGAVLREARATEHTADDYKTRLQEIVQGKLQCRPSYRIVSTTGPAHALRFEVEARVAGRVLGYGSGTTRKRAEQQAAKNAIEAFDPKDP